MKEPYPPSYLTQEIVVRPVGRNMLANLIGWISDKVCERTSAHRIGGGEGIKLLVYSNADLSGADWKNLLDPRRYFVVSRSRLGYESRQIPL